MQKHLSLLFAFAIAASAPVWAQSTKKPAAAAPAASNKRPLKLRSSWSIFLSDTLPKNEVIKLLDSAVIVRDEKNITYPVLSFAFTFEHHEPYLNDTTGQLAIYKDFTGDVFKTSSLSPLWSNRLKETIQSGDVLYFDNILIKYPGEKYYISTSLKFIVK
ncbi:hypothetical protein [Chitinophaga nivalis]|uniref:Uncharacterized protein n=1 Tax=Chitinophaga nivalis TaxID=2991709 RepID=A0ABT3IQ55_9BACT|nr:hypothetical protein [Chitinophaga nivalis]MCW3464303.1 hypothetical protein [Chitinophaga nivalis]MCW3486006.1 hypothetical protein [Chitinophaga nivalis]